MNKKKILFTCLSAILGLGMSVAVATGIGIARVSAGKPSYGEAFDYTQSNETVKYKTMQSDETDAARKGLLLFAYESGGKAEFKANLNGICETELKAVTHGGLTDLLRYSLVFTDIMTQKQFKIGVASSGAYSDAYVETDGEKAGIYYYTTAYDLNGTTVGYTAGMNASGAYTRFSNTGAAKIQFDPQQMQVKVIGDGGKYNLVWDFKQEFNDGKRFAHDLPTFGEYSVEIVLDEIKANGKGELLLYTLGGYTFDSAYVSSKPKIYADVSANAVVGEEYILPQARVHDLIAGELKDVDVSATVYDTYGNVLNDGAYVFTPTEPGEYYIYYKYGTGDAAVSAFYRISALEENELTYAFAYEDSTIDETEEIGAHTAIYIPKGVVESNLAIAGSLTETLVTVKKDSVSIEGYEKVAGGFNFTFEQTGVYEIIYEANVYGQSWKDTKFFTVSADVATLVTDTVAEEVPLGSTFTLPKATVYRGDESFSAETRIYYPSGKVSTEKQIVLDELGEYTLEYVYDGKVETQTFSARQPYSELFDTAFSSVQYGTLTTNNTLDGQWITLSGSDTVTYNQILDLSDNIFDENLADKSQNTPLIELFLQPKQIGLPDISALYLKFTDVEDIHNYFEVRLQYLPYIPNNIRIRTRAAGQTWVGYSYDFWTGELCVDSAESHNDGGTVVSLNPTHNPTDKPFENTVLRLYYDNEGGKLYTRTWQDKAANSTADNLIPIPWLIRDYKTNDPDLSASNTPWKGFSTGKVYFSMYASGVSDTANVLLRNLDGKDISTQYYYDNVPPSISVEHENNPPFAEVGTKFKVFDFITTDEYCAVVNSRVQVFYADREIKLTDGCFTPSSVGTYTLVYTAEDAFGNEARKEIAIQAKNSISNPAVELKNELPENVAYGETVTLPEAIGTGGAGGVTLTVEVRALKTNTIIPVRNGQFVCSEEGSYRILYTATDYIGQTAKREIWINGVARSKAPIFDESTLVLPKAFISGSAFEFTEYYADYYKADGTVERIKGKVTVTDANGEQEIDGVYTPKASADVKSAQVKITFVGAEGTTFIEREIPVLTIKQGLGFLANYFVSENAAVDAGQEDALYFAAENSAEPFMFSFVRAIHENYISLGFKRGKGAQFQTVSITLYDMYNGAKSVKFSYVNTENGLFLSINGGEYRKANYDVDGNFAIEYDSSTHEIKDTLNMNVGAITTYANGEEFSGFPSGYVYMDVVADGSVGFSYIGNQVFNNQFRDAKTPRIIIDGYFSGCYVPGDEIVLPKASAYDVLNTVTEITLTVRSADGKTTYLQTTADKENVFIPETYGSYSIVYTAIDAAKQKLSTTMTVIVVDDVKPTLTLQGEIPETASWGGTLTLPTYTVSDNGGAENVTVKIYVVAPNGLLETVKNNNIFFALKGEYTVYYFLVDENNNTANYTYHIQVA